MFLEHKISTQHKNDFWRITWYWKLEKMYVFIVYIYLKWNYFIVRRKRVVHKTWNQHSLGPIYIRLFIKQKYFTADYCDWLFRIKYSRNVPSFSTRKKTKHSLLVYKHLKSLKKKMWKIFPAVASQGLYTGCCSTILS